MYLLGFDIICSFLIIYFLSFCNVHLKFFIFQYNFVRQVMHSNRTGFFTPAFLLVTVPMYRLSVNALIILLYLCYQPLDFRSNMMGKCRHCNKYLYICLSNSILLLHLIYCSYRHAWAIPCRLFKAIA